MGLDDGIPKKFVLGMNRSKQLGGKRRLPMRGIKGHELRSEEDIAGIAGGDDEGVKLKKGFER